MFMVEVQTPGYPDDGLLLGPFNTKLEAEWRADYERKCAIELFGNDARAEIKTTVIGPRYYHSKQTVRGGSRS